MSGIILVFLVLFCFQAATGYWWWIFVVPFLCGAFRARTSVACLRSSAVGAGLLWMIGAVFALLTDGDRIASQVAVMGGIDNPVFAVLATALVAAVAGGAAGLTGYHLKKLILGRMHLKEEKIRPRIYRRTHRHDRGRPEGKDQEDQATAVAGGAGRSRTH